MANRLLQAPGQYQVGAPTCCLILVAAACSMTACLLLVACLLQTSGTMATELVRESPNIVQARKELSRVRLDTMKEGKMATERILEAGQECTSV